MKINTKQLKNSLRVMGLNDNLCGKSNSYSEGKDIWERFIFLQLNNKNKKLSSIFTFEENVEEIIISSSIPSTQSHYAETGKSTRFSCQNLFSSNL